jgi:hypothetical protein
MSAATGTTNLGREIFLVLRGAPSATPVAEINALATNTLGGSGNISAFVATLMVRKGNDLTANATPPPTLEATGIVSIALTRQPNARPSVVGLKGKLSTAKFSVPFMVGLYATQSARVKSQRGQ